MRRAPLAAVIAALVLLCARPAGAHVGSPDVYLDGNAGPYPLFVTVRIPQVIPGVADIEVRAGSDDVREIRTTVTTLSGAGAKYAPVPDLAIRSKQDPRFFTSSLWLMENGSLQVRIIADGARGEAQMAVPIASFAQRTFAMPRWLGAILLVFMITLALGMVSVIGAAARESALDPGAAPAPTDRARGRRAMAITAAIAAAAFYLALGWWSADALNHQRIVGFFKPPTLQLTLQSGSRLVLKPVEEARPQRRTRLSEIKMDEMIPDHGHLMHLFMIRMPGFDRVWHLHPALTPDGSFTENLPPMSSGRYQVFADLVHKSGFPLTMIGQIDLPEVPGTPLSGDDSGGTVPPIGESTGAVFDLPDGGRVVWNRDSGPIKANAPIFLRFTVEDETGKPADDLQDYMGMAAHAAIVRSDLSVFAHIHPSGTVPMASLMLASADAGDSGQAPLCRGWS